MRRYHNRYRRPKSRHVRVSGRFFVFIAIVAGIVAGIIFAVMFFTGKLNFGDKKETPTPTPTVSAQPQATPEATQSAPPQAIDGMPSAVAATNPEEFGFKTDISVDGQIAQTYDRANKISFPTGDEYTKLKGISTFRGNNYRNFGSYGQISLEENKLEKGWEVKTGTLTKWSGSGWTGQPLIINWDADMRLMMNIKDEKKQKDNLTEVIYPTMDGKIYFIDLEDGKYTREPIDMGVTIKGTASVDPRGYPLLYVGQGVGLSGENNWDNTYMYVYSLIDCKVLYKYGYETKDEFSYRDSWQAYDSSPLVAEDADTLIWPGENGILYTTKLNSEFDRGAGTVSINPDEPVKYRYTTPLNTDDAGTGRWYGMENSAAAWKNYLFFTDNGGWLQCVDLNTMKLVYAQDITDDSDASLLLEEEGENVYLYTGSEIDKQIIEGEETGTAYVRKINGLTGEIVWEVPYTCYYVNKVDGGILASPVLGRGNMEGMVIFAVARTGSKDEGLLVAYDKNTGSVIWEHKMDRYAWSSPVAVYTADNKGYLIQCDNGGNMKLIDGTNGEVVSTINLGENIEATPAVFNNTVVVGTRGERIFGVNLK